MPPKREQVAKTIGCTIESLRPWYAEGKKQWVVTEASKRESKATVCKTRRHHSAVASHWEAARDQCA